MTNFMFTVGLPTVSDKGRRGERRDRSGEVIREVLSKLDVSISNYDVVPNE